MSCLPSNKGILFRLNNISYFSMFSSYEIQSSSSKLLIFRVRTDNAYDYEKESNNNK